ncbi:MAG: C-terminal binding protein [Alphaproteobacteria bacterium]|nr:C-terminal binding protein [Alphaproteobacteria bacterium]
MATVVQTDYAWADNAIERTIIEGAGHRLVIGPSAAAPPAEIESLIGVNDPSAILTCWAKISDRAIALPKGLKIVARYGVGLDNIDVAAATARGAWVTNVPDYCVEEVSDHALAMILGWTRGLVSFDREVKRGRWDPSGARLRRTATLTAGILGFGRIGRATARKLRGIGLDVLAYDVAVKGGVPHAELVGLDRLLHDSDVIIVHLPLNEETRHFVDDDFLKRMRKGSFLVNVSRGPVVDNDALIRALDSGAIAGAALDVVEGEPNPPAALIARPDVIATPHIAFSSDESLAELRRRGAEEVVRVLAGEKPHNPCNKPAGR